MDLTIKRLEEIALNSWPALEQVFFDGWILRTANGYTKRANSVNPLYRSSIKLAEKIEYCSTYYGHRGLPTLFRLTPVSCPPQMDSYLADLHYLMFDPTLVLVRGIDPNQLDRKLEEDVELIELEGESWLAIHSRFYDTGGMGQEQHQQILEAIPYRHCLGVVSHRGDAVACGLAVLEGDVLGLFDLVTAPEARRQGFGTFLIHELLRWGQQYGATRAYLQVMEANAPARRLYGNLGFKTHYRYWYRAL